MAKKRKRRISKRARAQRAAQQAAADLYLAQACDLLRQALVTMPIRKRAAKSMMRSLALLTRHANADRRLPPVVQQSALRQLVTKAQAKHALHDRVLGVLKQ